MLFHKKSILLLGVLYTLSLYTLSIHAWLGLQPTVLVESTDASSPLSNQYMNTIIIDGQSWPSVEHYMCAQSFKDKKMQSRIKRAKTAQDALIITRDPKNRSKWIPEQEWLTIRDIFMRKALGAKFIPQQPTNTSTNIQKALKDTDNAVIIYDVTQAVSETTADNIPTDLLHFGKDQKKGGENTTGKILMEIRKQLPLEPSKPVKQHSFSTKKVKKKKNII